MPVLLSAATWTRDCTMTEWITEQLLRSQPNLDVRIRTSTGATVWLPKALAESGLIPVIDGLDELPPDRWAAVITEVNAFGSDYPLVLTSRPAEFQVATAARTISQAVVIELEPLQVPEIKQYLSEATDAPAERWAGVFDVLDAEPDGVLASTLATPLMIWLARTVYQAGTLVPANCSTRSGSPIARLWRPTSSRRSCRRPTRNVRPTQGPARSAVALRRQSAG